MLYINKKKLFNIIFAFVFLFIFFLTLEAIQRLRHPHVGFRGMYNSLGFRSQEFEPKKKPGTIRILFMGSSTTFGVGNTLENTYPFLVGRILSEKLDSVRIETINGAMPAKGSFWVVERIKHSLYLDPDIIISMTGYNDSATTYNDSVRFSKEGELILRHPWYVKLSNFLACHSVFYVTLREKIAIILYGDPRFAFSRPKTKPGEDKLIKPSWLIHYPQYYRNNLGRMIKIADRHKIKLIFLNPPLSALRKKKVPIYAKKFFRLKEELFKESLNFNIPIIDLEGPLSESVIGEYISTDGIHFTDKGNLKIAQVISDFLIKNKKEYFLQ